MPTDDTVPPVSIGEVAAELLAANEQMGAALVEIGLLLGLPNPFSRIRWGAPEIVRRIAAVRRALDSIADDLDERAPDLAVAVRAVLDPADEAAHIGVDARGILWMAQRYSIGRGTYAGHEVCDAIHAHAHQLPAWTRLRMADEIDDNLDRGMVPMPDTHPMWRAAAAHLRDIPEETP